MTENIKIESTQSTLKTHQEINDILDIYTIHEWTAGSVMFKPNGTKIWRALERYIQDQYKHRGFSEVITPQLVNAKLFKQSGHLDNYQQNMFCVEIKEDVAALNGNKQSDQPNPDPLANTFYLKPMSCPIHCLMFKDTLRSYRNLPIRMADFGALHRNECSGALRGLNRLRRFCQDDAHIFCRPDQIFDEIKNCMGFLDDVYKLFGFDYEVFLSTRPDKFMGDLELWIEAEQNLSKALDAMTIPYLVNDKDGAFYGPKIDIMLTDAAGRKVQCGTIQLDFQLPQNFNLEYVDYDAQKSIPVIIHRAIFGSIERMISIILEHFQGKLPLWLSPRQVAIIPVTTKPDFLDYCNKIKQSIEQCDPRLDSVEIFNSSDTFASRIRDAEVSLYSYVLIVGKKEIDSNCVTYRIVNHKREDVLLAKLEDVCQAIKNAHYDKTL